MAHESGEKIKLLDEYMEILKQELLFSMAEQRKLKPESTMHQRIITIKRELDKAAQERMRLIRMHYRNINIRIALSGISA